MRTGLGLSLTLPRRRAGGSAVPPLLRLSQVTTSEDFQSTIDTSSSWFWTPPTGTMQCVVVNPEPDAVESAELVLENREATSGAVVGWSVQSGGTWGIDNISRTPAPGGSLASPTISFTPPLTLPSAVAQNGSFRLHVAMGDGLLTAAKTFSEGYWPTTNRVNSANFNPGTILNSVPSNFIGIGVFQSRLIMRHGAGSSPKCIAAAMGDSTAGQVCSLAYTPNTTKEGVWMRGNDHAIAQGWRIRIYSYGQGGASWADIQARTRANLPTLVGRVNMVMVMTATWNTPLEGAGAAAAAWAEYLALEAEIKAAGLIAVPYILHPYTTRNTANQIAGWTQMRNFVTSHPYGQDYSDITGSTSFPDLVPSESLDNIHMDPPGSTRCGPLIMARFRTLVQSFYPGL